MLALIAIAVAAPVAGVLGYAATRPGAFQYRRSTTIQAPPEAILTHINDFRRWTEWSPWEALDPGMKRTYGGAATGVGATYAWEGRKAGSGQMIIRETSPSRIVIQLDFSKPFEAHNTAEFVAEPRGDATQLTWSMHGNSPFMSKVFGVFVNMDRLIGKDFETGLANLKRIAEAQAAAPAAAR
jgi:carbon monoxide dehydrogenase subunit G